MFRFCSAASWRVKAARPHRVVAWVMPPIGHLAAAAFYFRFSVFVLILLCCYCALFRFLCFLFLFHGWRAKSLWLKWQPNGYGHSQLRRGAGIMHERLNAQPSAATQTHTYAHTRTPAHTHIRTHPLVLAVCLLACNRSTFNCQLAKWAADLNRIWLWQRTVSRKEAGTW